MDMRKYTTGFLKPDDVRDGPRQETIVNVYESEKYSCPVLDFESGDQFLLNVTNNKILCKAWGFKSDHWRGLVLELALGHYKDWRSDPPEEKETVTVRAVSERQPSSDNGGAPILRPSRRNDFNDEIPFLSDKYQRRRSSGRRRRFS
jgi:hypothetical protein